MILAVLLVCGSIHMTWLHVTLEVIGAMTILVGAGALLVWLALFRPMRKFAGGNCTDSEQELLTAPDGRHTVKSFHRVCGSGGKETLLWLFGVSQHWQSKSWVRIHAHRRLRDVGAHTVSIACNGPDQIVVSYPSTGKLEDVYATILGVRVAMDPRASLESKQGTDVMTPMRHGSIQPDVH